MMDKQVIAYLKIGHGIYNLTVVSLFIYQALLGFRIRKGRQAGNIPMLAVRTHRKTGPVLALLGIAGYTGGVVLGFLDNGRLMKYPLHFLIGTFVAITIVVTFYISRGIRGQESPLRTLHLRLGVTLLFLYCIQVVLGLGVFF